MSEWVGGMNLMFFHHHAHSIAALEETKRKKNSNHHPWEMPFIHSIYISAIVLQKYEYFVYNFWCHVSYWWGYDENGKVEDEEEKKILLGIGRQRKRELASKQASKQAREAWKMKIFPINTKLNEHDFWDIDGFQFFFFVFHLLCKKKEWKKVYFDIFMLRDQLRWGKFFFLSRSLHLCFREWMDDGMAMRGQKLFLIARYCWWEMACMCVSQIHHCQSIVNSWQLWLMGDFEHENWITVELILYKASRHIAFLIRLCNKSYHHYFFFKD